MEEQILRKIRGELERGIKSECQVVYLLVEIRKLMDKSNVPRHSYESLRLYCDWVVHVDIDRNAVAKRIVRTADDIFAKLIRGSLADHETSVLKRVFSLDVFREELGQFLEENRMRRFSGSEWNAFAACFLNVIEDCPLLCKGDNASGSEIDEVVVMRDVRRVPGGSL